MQLTHFTLLRLAVVLLGVAKMTDSAAFLVPSQLHSLAQRRQQKGRDLTKESSSNATPGQSKTRSDGRKLSRGAHFLTPSQVRGIRRPSGNRTSRHQSRRCLVIISSSTEDSDAGDEVVFKGQNPASAGRSDSENNRESNTRVKGTKKKSSTQDRATAKGKARKLRMTGNIPDVYWRAIPLEHLRHHPNFEALPHPDTITHLKSLEDTRLFRQDSWQWDALHSGRCTTSQATAALGLLEPLAGKVLGIPRSLQKGAVGAFHRLQKPAIRSLEDMNDILCTGEGNSPMELEILDAPVWNDDEKIRMGMKKKFAAVYLPRIRQSDLDRRRELLKTYYYDDTSRWIARMQWGNAQEPTSILTALNYFTRTTPGTKIREVGMCGAGLEINSTATEDRPGLIVGATPDAVIHYPNGTLEALEVKNHCPFVPFNFSIRRKDGKSSKSKDLFRIRESRVHVDVPPAYVSQLMMEMMSLGPQCRSAIMVRQTATKGAVILRLLRDDEWIDEAIYWLTKFTESFVNEDVPPPTNFFWEEGEYSGGERYRAFVKRTKEISESAELVYHVPHAEIQRVVSARRFQIPLFLD